MRKPLRPRTELCHYIKLRYLREMINDGVFVGTRLDLWHRRDRMEGRYNVEDQARLDSEAIEAFQHLGISKSDGEEAIQIARKYDLSARFFCVYVVCFRKDDQEREECWETYLHGQPGVMLRTTVGRVLSCHRDSIGFEDIVYVDHDTESAIDMGKLSFFCKRKCFSWERELRMTRYVVMAFHKDGRVIDLADRIQLYERRFGLKEGVRQLEMDLDKEGFVQDPLRHPPRLPIHMNMTNLFSEVVMSPGISDDEERLVRATIAAGGLNTHVR